MRRDNLVLSAEEKCPLSITCTIIDSNQHPISLPPFNNKSISLGKTVDTDLSIIKSKEMIDEETNDIDIIDLAISPDESHLVPLLSDQSIVFYRNDDYPR